MSKEIEKIYEVYMPGSHAPEEYGEEKAEKCALIAEKYGFTDISSVLQNENIYCEGIHWTFRYVFRSYRFRRAYKKGLFFRY